ncbi:hypothetical protein D9619_006564 [Psilocybe cf. subviscida]|uniref:CENP-V/GFA domain-containing protein n=1 Tax=Psilocybe cf. subviscida TaxID=2480587 RepID=A0A8H5EXZ8_9AGAR|nr:hypothetical protein D9619_006564 [Psilocybe cf. subviscida]
MFKPPVSFSCIRIHGVKVLKLAKQLAFIQGEGDVKDYADGNTLSGRTTKRSFCSNCGGNLFIKPAGGDIILVHSPAIEGSESWVPKKESHPQDRLAWVKEVAFVTKAKTKLGYLVHLDEVELGCTNWDTADMYGDNEDLVGKWFKYSGKRDKIFLATKFGVTPTGINNAPEYIRSAVEKSLKRLGVDQIDLYYAHRADNNVPIEQTVSEMAKLVKEGKVRYLGLSEVSEAALRRAHAVHPIAALQVEYSPFFLDIEEPKIGLLKACEELGVAVIAYSPLGRGMLTGTYKSNDDIPEDDWRKVVPKFSNENFPNILKLVSTLEGIGKKHNATAGQITLAWLLTRSPSVISIPGTKKIKYLKENLDALSIKLTDEEIKEIKGVADEANTSSEETKVYQGNCLCGRVQFTLAGGPFHYAICNCKNCKQSSGSAFLTYAAFKPEQLSFVEGESDVKDYTDSNTQSGRAIKRSFCSHCGGNLFIKPIGRDLVLVHSTAIEGSESWVPERESFPQDRLTWVKDITLATIPKT